MTKTFPMATILSLLTGRLMCKFDNLHELAEYLTGHPIWTHEFADQRLWGLLKVLVWQQHPDLEVLKAEECTEKNFPEWLASAVEKLGESREFRQVSDQRTEIPIESAARILPGKLAIMVVLPNA